MTRFISFPLLFSALVFAACSSDDTKDSTGVDPDAGLQDAPQDAPQEATEDALETDTSTQDVDKPDVSGECVDVTSVSGSAVDEADNPFSADVILCIYQEGSAKCLSPVKGNSAGVFKVDMPGGTACLEGTSYQIKSFADMTRVGLYCSVDLGSGGDVVTPSPDRLVTAPQCSRTPLGSDTEPHEIVAPDGAAMTLIPDGVFLFDFDYEDIRLLTWDESWGWPCFLDPSDPPEGLIAFAPELEVKKGATDALHVSFPNDAGLTPGTEVDLYALGGASTDRWDGTTVHEGYWEVIGEAVVTTDGSRIETRAGEGLPFGTWVGWKQK